MQLDNNPAAIERQLWNWKHNLESGRVHFENDKAISDKYFRNNHTARVDSIFYMNAYELYNSGKNYYSILPISVSQININKLFYYFNPIWGWALNPKRGSENYGKIVYEIYKNMQ
jgi:hypothetical protein